MVHMVVINMLLVASLALLIYSWFKRKNATIYLLRFCIVVSVLLTPCLAEEHAMMGVIGIPAPVQLSDSPVIILGVQGEYTGNPYEEQSAWMAGIEAFLNGTLINNYSNNTTMVA